MKTATRLFAASSILFLFSFLNACHTPSGQDPVRQATDSVVVVHQPLTLPELPKTIVFAGETIHLEDEDIFERMDRELLVNTYFQSATTQIIKRANRWFPLIESILHKEGIPEDFKYLAIIESGLVQAVSPAGAEGFWQFMPFTAQEYGLEISKEVDERLDVEKSTLAACQYLKRSKDSLGNWISAAASYNRGIGGVKRDMAWQQADSYFDAEQNTETGRYVFRLMAMKIILENQTAYGFHIPDASMYKPFETKKINIKETIPDLSQWAIHHGINFKILKKLNPWLKANKLTIKNKTYVLLLPVGATKLKPYKEYLK